MNALIASLRVFLQAEGPISVAAPRGGGGAALGRRGGARRATGQRHSLQKGAKRPDHHQDRHGGGQAQGANSRTESGSTKLEYVCT